MKNAGHSLTGKITPESSPFWCRVVD